MYYNTKKLKPSLVAFHDIQSGNGEGLFSKEKINKKSKEKRISEEGYHINKQIIYIALKSQIESRVHYAPEPIRWQNNNKSN